MAGTIPSTWVQPTAMPNLTDLQLYNNTLAGTIALWPPRYNAIHVWVSDACIYIQHTTSCMYCPVWPLWEYAPLCTGAMPADSSAPYNPECLHAAWGKRHVHKSCTHDQAVAHAGGTWTPEQTSPACFSIWACGACMQQPITSFTSASFVGPQQAQLIRCAGCNRALSCHWPCSPGMHSCVGPSQRMYRHCMWMQLPPPSPVCKPVCPPLLLVMLVVKSSQWHKLAACQAGAGLHVKVPPPLDCTGLMGSCTPFLQAEQRSALHRNPCRRPCHHPCHHEPPRGFSSSVSYRLLSAYGG